MPFEEGHCGPNLEYDNAFLELQQAATGKPESQFEPALPPDWNVVESASVALLQRSRDLRLVVLWAESQLHLRGFGSLPLSLNVLAGFLESAWLTVNPPLDDGDPYPRINVIDSLGFGGSFYQSLRHCVVVRNSRLGDVRLKDFEALSGNSSTAEPTVSRDQLEQYFRMPEGNAAQLRGIAQRSQLALKRIIDAVAIHVEPQSLPQLPEFKSLLSQLLALLPEPDMEQTAVPVPPSESMIAGHTGVSGAASASGAVNASVGIQSRSQALIAIDQVCAYLEHAEPTNPAQLLLKRARRLIDKNFMQLMKELAPEAVSEVAKIMGINPDSLEQEDA